MPIVIGYKRAEKFDKLVPALILVRLHQVQLLTSIFTQQGSQTNVSRGPREAGKHVLAVDGLQNVQP